MFAFLPCPFIATILLPRIECFPTTTNPGEVVQAATPAKHLSTGIWLSNTLVVWLVDEGRLIGPVVLAVSEFKCASGRRNRRDIVWITITMSVERIAGGWNTYPTPASITRTFTSGFSANLPAMTFPAVPPPTTIKSYVFGVGVAIVKRKGEESHRIDGLAPDHTIFISSAVSELRTQVLGGRSLNIMPWFFPRELGTPFAAQ